MKIVLITPVRPSSRSGNGTTTARWRRILRALGHTVRVTNQYDGTAADMMIALHAWRSADSIRRFRELNPDRPLVVALTGTDINDYLDSDPVPTLRSLAYADRLVVLQSLARRRVPTQFRRKIRVIHQSVPTQRRAAARSTGHLDVLVIGHLRDVKDPLRAAEAARLLPASSRIRIVHLGAAETAQWAARAEAEMKSNPRYVWRGEKPRAEVRRQLARARAVVLASLHEGGANVISEAVAAGAAVLASRIDGSVGLLGHDYPGYFPARDTAALARLLHRIESDPEFLRRLRRAIARRAPLFRPAREAAAWKKLIAELTQRSRAKRGRQR